MNILKGLLLIVFITPFAFAEALSPVDKNKIISHFNSYVDKGNIPNVSILIKKDNKEIFRHAYGYADIDSKTKVNKILFIEYILCPNL